MTTRVSPAVIAGYTQAVMGAFDPASQPGRRLTDWLRNDRICLGVDVAAVTGSKGTSALSAQEWEQLRAHLAARAGQLDGIDTIDSNVRTFAAAIGLPADDVAVFRFVLYTNLEPLFHGLCTSLVGTRRTDAAGLVAIAVGMRPADAAAALRRGTLTQLQLVQAKGQGAMQFDFFVPDWIRQALLPPNDGLADIERRLIGLPLKARLVGEDFAHVARERDFIGRLLRGAVRDRLKGINVLLYGPPGTGKTELCKVIGAETGLDLFAIGETDTDGDEPTRGERIEALRLAERLAGRRAGAVLLFDEMEDILQQGERSWMGRQHFRRSGSKVFFNRLLEQNSVPVLWTANGLWEFDPGFLRRMTFAFEMPTPPTKLRMRLWDGVARSHGLTLPAGGAETLARRFRVPPGLMVGATHAVVTAGGSAEDIDFVVKALAKPLIGRLRPAESAPPFGFDPALANADADLADLAGRLARPEAPRDVTLCLYGPPGTGKSAFARQLADRMGLDVLVKRGSELLSMWLGETERLIAEAFEEAALEERFLIIDEVETFLWNRGAAERSWEVSRVNELLVAMESHPLPFACTTNHLEQIDTAALRRFAFKVKFDYLTPAQAEAAYRRFFDRAPPAALKELAGLTPGDFAAVARKLRFTGESAVADDALIGLLEQEMAVKNLPRRIGF